MASGWIDRFRSPTASIASRLFLGVAAWSLLILLLAGIGLTTFYRTSASAISTSGWASMSRN